MSGQTEENKQKIPICAGLLAHVDAGKTTLSEGLLYLGGSIRQLGRVDHQDAFLDTFALERQRGITIFSKQAILPLKEVELTLLDTPGHVDFSSEMERTLQVLDCAILVISGPQGLQSHTRTLWNLLERYHIPTFIFCNKMDLPGAEAENLLHQLGQLQKTGFVNFSPEEPLEKRLENLALCDERTMETYLEQGEITREEIRRLVAERKVFPCYFGSALRLNGVEELLEGLEQYAPRPQYPSAFGARVFKIARDPQGVRLTYLKVTGGELKVKALLTNRPAGETAPGEYWEEKADQLRLYSGAKYQTISLAQAGTVCAVTGLTHTYPGEGLGFEENSESPFLEPVLSSRMILPEGCDPYAVFLRLRQLEEEDPQLHLVWNESLGEIHLQVMGKIQLEVLRQVISERFGLEVDFGPGSILYRETILDTVEGVGHFEPLRHYAEVHLILRPGPRGSGLQFDSSCSEDQLDRNWQRLILTHLKERIHPGVLTGSPITDLHITLAAGKAHLKHTEGGDFRQATYRAVRQGLMKAQNQLLEPWYSFRLELPSAAVGRAMSDLQRMGAQFQPPETSDGQSILTGSAPVSAMGDYQTEVTSYTQGQGRLSCTILGYLPCHNTEEVVAAKGYDPLRDLENPPDSVFCSHGAGVVVPWDQVDSQMHLESVLKKPSSPTVVVAGSVPRSSYSGSLEEDKELQAIFERTYGPIRRRDTPLPLGPERSLTPPPPPEEPVPEYLLVDGYNILFAWEELKTLAKTNIDAARQALMDLLCNYQGYKNCVLILVFDAYKVPGNTGTVSRYHNIYVVYTKEAETADAYIEKATFDIGQRHKVRVATSDGLEQLIILGHGALRISAKAFREEVERVEGLISAAIAENARRNRFRDKEAAGIPIPDLEESQEDVKG
ncbi:translation factor GTPase family protein [Angelakisella massiliensis]|uniref:translation factor GTPase family protein n=1 Tax=Angelakisella massiliensis TaxID=1871018 RepID=UPI0023A7B783|nr:TetM/TetW/TetO/TetS family tetracycline resistance ribosomal protection protein [Angelakisella massiliensis]